MNKDALPDKKLAIKLTGGDDLLGSLSSELSNELLHLLGIGLATAGGDDGSDILLSGVGFSAENGEEISGDVLHDSVSALLWGATTHWCKKPSKTVSASEPSCELRQQARSTTRLRWPHASVQLTNLCRAAQQLADADMKHADERAAEGAMLEARLGRWGEGEKRRRRRRRRRRNV